LRRLLRLRRVHWLPLRRPPARTPLRRHRFRLRPRHSRIARFSALASALAFISGIRKALVPLTYKRLRMRAWYWSCCYNERKGYPHGTDHEPQYEEDRDRADGPRGDERADLGPDRHGPDGEPGGRWRGERGDRARGARALRAPAGGPGHRAHPAPVGKYVAWPGPEREGARELGAERPEDGRGRGLDAREYRRGVGGEDACRPRRGRGRVHGMGDAAPRDDVPAGQTDQGRP